MMIWRQALLAIAMAASASPARSEALVSMLSTNAVEITSNYTGTEIAIFGAIERDASTVSRGAPYQMVITVKGPSVPLVVREKEKTGIIWMNSDQRKFGEVPGFYAVLSSGPLDDVIDPDTQRKLLIGPQAITSSLEGFSDDLPVTSEPRISATIFERALLRLRREQGFYRLDSGGGVLRACQHIQGAGTSSSQRAARPLRGDGASVCRWRYAGEGEIRLLCP